MADNAIKPTTSYLGGNPRGSAFPFVVEPFSEDYRGHLSWRFMGNHLLRCASLHAGQHGFGYEDMQASHRAWVLSRLVVELEEMPSTGEAYTIETWINRTYRQFTDRLFAVTGTTGRTYGYAFTTWALIDIDSRLPIDLSALADGVFADVAIDKAIPINPPRRIRLRNPQPVRQLQTYYSDLDINGHVNSIRYIEMMLDLFPRTVYDHRAVRRIEVAYSAETYIGDTLTIYAEKQEDGDTHVVEIRRADGASVVKAAISFAPTPREGTSARREAT